jgi:putative pyruvate formate lyase activating enzyme
MAGSYAPPYLELAASGALDRRAEQARAHLTACDLCPLGCRADRTSARLGVCHTGAQAGVSSFFAHHGEEYALSGTRGSGTIFFTGCNMRCMFCQNAEISQLRQGRTVSAGELASMMLHLQGEGCHNINFVTPSHVVPHIIEAVSIAARQGLRLPLVYNSGGYDALYSLSLLDGIIDIYMPDMKYANAYHARRYSKAARYPEHNQAAVREMHRQVGDLVLDERGIAQRGLLVRHLVLPGGLAGTLEIARFLADEVSKDTYLNIMGQYHPEFEARKSSGLLGRAVTRDEMNEAYTAAKEAGLWRFAS